MKPVLIGFMGSGKSTIGRALSKRLHLDFVDVDEWIEENYKKKIKDIFREEGEESFRDIETKALSKLFEGKDNVLIATGGGVVMKERNISLLRRNSFIIYLKVKAETVVERLREDVSRPLLLKEDREAYILELLERRDPLYQACCHVMIPTDGLTIEEVVSRCELKIQRYSLSKLSQNS